MNLSTAEKQQYNRHLILEDIGVEGQLKLKQASVLVIGAGGLSCPVLQYLTAAGVGKIGIVDDDTVDQSNLQRQILYNHKDIRKNKAEAAASHLQLLNPFISFDTYNARLTKENALALFKKYSIIVDGTDNFPTRYLINDAAILLKKPVVFGSIFKFEGQVSVFNYNNGPSYSCLYPTPPKPNEVPNCSEIGVLGVLPGIIGSLQANEVLKIILGLGNVLSGKLLTFNALSMKQTIFSFKKNTTVRMEALQEDYQAFCGIPKVTKEISFEEYKAQSSHYNLLDVRTQREREECHIKSIHIPLAELALRVGEIPQDKSLLVFCKSGVRGKLAIEILQNKGFKETLVNLKDGLLNGVP
ncbi:molybdopterin-synthase adenylyltransferase MoeB [Lacinutrix neustonica]|uniref:Molybdopterin-synthase adenylyltransferase n=1 Tax=Lacinutrix neustonica TaxID=2980107 RepID=A0A9E8SCG5_9FLAO|nr:molybdopterin-synthase adenylyltransferase MoeB [Lacinutrix neustonica]WAC01263.1 molybdopterin-synthase adenylyltransferase MoeB [Lacinutrix neustonica]